MANNIDTSKFKETKQQLLDTDYDFKQAYILKDELVDYFEKATVEGTIIKERLEEINDRMRTYSQFLDYNRTRMTNPAFKAEFKVVHDAFNHIRHKYENLSKNHKLCYDGLRHLKDTIKQLDSLIIKAVNEKIEKDQYMSKILEEVNELVELAFIRACNIELFQQNNSDYQIFLSKVNRFDDLMNDIRGTIYAKFGFPKH
ncbi:uncharacterized protein LOC106648306 [Trichogramma pretiosum]|uniref:uncharacterized protein LOC106648306 n=1 Tax=Trichogramma pretiosum TaxID=7493 RepID=UPI0006C99BAB|nr:uncharacterized protein LOC106648306 [Trichogramma pretiosum]